MKRRMVLGIVPAGATAASPGARVSAAGVFLFAGLAIGCSGGFFDGGLLFPSSASTPAPVLTPTCGLSGSVSNDGSGFDEPAFPVGGATVTVLDGPNAGKSAVSSSQGEYTMSGLKSGDGLIEVRSDGYERITERVFVPCGITYVAFRIGQPPHILRSQVLSSETGWAVIDATVEIVDGTNAGRRTQTDDQGAFQFSDLQTSEEFSIVVGKMGFRKATIAVDRLARNTKLSTISLKPN